MTDFRAVTAEFSVSPQVTIEDVARAGSEGFCLIINNRPDGEVPGQPSSAEIEAAAVASGLSYAHIPVSGRPTAEQVEVLSRALAAGRTLAFCRSGTRSIMTWALGRLESGELDRGQILAACARAGYDLSAVLPG